MLLVACPKADAKIVTRATRDAWVNGEAETAAVVASHQATSKRRMANFSTETIIKAGRVILITIPIIIITIISVAIVVVAITTGIISTVTREAGITTTGTKAGVAEAGSGTNKAGAAATSITTQVEAINLEAIRDRIKTMAR